MDAGRRVLLLYPAFPPTYWGLQYALPAIGKRSYMPPLGLITVAAMFPAHRAGGTYEFRLVDCNCAELTADDLAWADFVLLSAMITQKRNLLELAERCRAAGLPVVMGGPFPTACPDMCAPYADCVVCGEMEAVRDEFFRDLGAGALRARYENHGEKPDITLSPTPRYDLLDTGNYLSMPVQYSRGCPFRCEFCDIIVMYGRKPRTKTSQQVLRELAAVHATGFRGEVFVVDDNFIGNKREAQSLLSELHGWNRSNGHPFTYGTEASVDLARYPDLLESMANAGFRWVFLGIETPSKESLGETLKLQNLKGSLEDAVSTILAAGLHVTAGFIVGFDSDREDIFDRQIDFIERTAIPMALVGLLVALPGTPLHARLKGEGRLSAELPFDLADECGHTNIKTKLEERALLEGYRRTLGTLYEPARYFERAYRTIERFRRPATFAGRAFGFVRTMRAGLRFFGRTPREFLYNTPARLRSVASLVRSMPPDFRRAARRLAWRTLRRRPDQLGSVLDFTIIGWHMYRFSTDHVLPELDARLAARNFELTV